MSLLAVRSAEAAEAIETYCRKGAFPGAVFLVRSGGSTIHLSAHGFAVLCPEKLHMHEGTIFDTASLTKPLITALLVLLLHQEGTVSLDDQLVGHRGSDSGLKHSPAILDALTHRTGIPAWYPLYCHGRTLESYVKTIAALPLNAPPRTSTEYSCLNYILLTAELRELTGQPLSSLARKQLFAPLDLSSASIGGSTAARSDIAATEAGNTIEREMAARYDCILPEEDELIHGIVHDRNCRVAGGETGNAGLFSSIEDAALLAEQFGPRSQLLNEETRALLLHNYTPFGPQFRTIGWMRSDSPESSSGGAFSDSALGHTGFTGCSLWYDIEIDLTVALFTNRIHPQPSTENIQEVRRSIHRILTRKA